MLLCRRPLRRPASRCQPPTGHDDFADNNVDSIALEVPRDLLGSDPAIGVWATISLRDITMNAIAPALECPGAAADIVNLVTFLVSEDGHWVKGQVIRRMASSVAKPRATDQGFDGCEARREAPR